MLIVNIHVRDSEIFATSLPHLAAGGVNHTTRIAASAGDDDSVAITQTLAGRDITIP
jgi:hypothetical protein